MQTMKVTMGCLERALARSAAHFWIEFSQDFSTTPLDPLQSDEHMLFATKLFSCKFPQWRTVFQPKRSRDCTAQIALGAPRAVQKIGCFPPSSHTSQGPEFCTPCCFELTRHASVGGDFLGVFPG